MRKIDVSEINSRIRRSPENFVSEFEKGYFDRIHKVAEDIGDHYSEWPIILISGPSGSGKTTTALLLERYLESLGHDTHTISMDNYFYPLTQEQQEAADHGELDLESPGRLDILYLNEQLKAIIHNESVDIPKFDFTHSRRQSGYTLKRKPGELVILEGIHALNPEVITLPDDTTCRIYVSVRTRVSDRGYVLHPEYIRLMRRMLRDREHRGRSVADTLEMLPGVKRGEDRFIMPYKHRSMYDIDTFIDYEPAAYRPILIDDIRTLTANPAMKHLLDLLENLEPLPERYIPGDALIREFIGGSVLNY